MSNANAKADSPVMTILRQINASIGHAVEKGHCFGSGCGKLLTSNDKDHAFCNACWDKAFAPRPSPSTPPPQTPQQDAAGHLTLLPPARRAAAWAAARAACATIQRFYRGYLTRRTMRIHLICANCDNPGQIVNKVIPLATLETVRCRSCGCYHEPETQFHACGPGCGHCVSTRAMEDAQATVNRILALRHNG